MLTQARLMEVLRYNPFTGLFTWTSATNDSILIGSVAGSLNGAGRIQIQIDKEVYLAHRLAFLYMDGFIPEFVDHIDTIPTHNWWTNLRGCTHQQNMCNAKLRKDSCSGIKGVSWDLRKKKWCAYITVSNKRKHLGYFGTKDAAELVVREARIKLHGDFANHGV